MRNKTYLVWLEWPEKCFCADAEALRRLKALVPKGSRVVRARSEAGFLRALPTATHAIVWSFRPEWFAKAPRLEVLATPAAGRELMPAEAPKGVRLHFGHFHGEIIAESVIGFMFGWAKGFFALSEVPAKCRAWPRTWLSDKCRDVAGSRAVIVGYGHIGRAVGKKLASLGVEVAGITRHGVFTGESPNRRTVEPSKLFRRADWLILALPATSDTNDILNAALLRKLPRKCVVINVGRANAVDERALVAALKAGRIAGAYLDVFKREKSQIWNKCGVRNGVVDFFHAKIPNLVLMPHSAAFSPHYVLSCLEELKRDGCL